MITFSMAIMVLFHIFALSQNSEIITVQDNSGSKNNSVLPKIQQYVANIQNDFVLIPEARKEQLKRVALFIKKKNAIGEEAKLLFICTHNSRRSHMGQVWSQTAAEYYSIKNVVSYSGGTEVSACNPRTIKVFERAGFEVIRTDTTKNPLYHITYAKERAPIKAFSKTYIDAFNLNKNFAAIMTCSQADNSCPNVEGASIRISLPYDDPKISDNTPEEEKTYDERSRQIAVEMFYLFSQVSM